ncbi:MAG TPA: hypothetical protein VF310_06210 [Vicinamibacteria bacterium]
MSRWRLLLALAALGAAPGALAQSRLVRMGDESAGRARRVELAALGDERVVAVVQDADRNLKAIVYDVTASGKFTRRDSAEAGQASVFAVTALGTRSFITAVRQEDGTLRLIRWKVGDGGTITRGDSADAGTVDRVELAVAGPSRVVTATQSSSNGDMTKLIVWDVRSDGTFDRKGEGIAAPGTRLAVAALNASQVVCAVRKPGGTLAVSAWRLSRAGELTARGSASGPKVSEVTLTNTASDRVVTAVRLDDGTVEVQAWDVPSDGSVTAAGSERAGAADNLALAAVGAAKVVTALRQADGTLKLITWQVVDAVTRRDDVSAGTVGRVSVATLGWDRIVTAIQVAADDLMLIDWSDCSVGMLRAQWRGAGAAGTPAPPGPPPAQPSARRRGHDADTGPQRRPRRPGARPVADVPEAALTGAPRPPNLPTALRSNNFSARFHPTTQGVDPMIAVGEDYVVVTQDHAVEFLYKRDGTGHHAGDRLPSKGGEATYLSSRDFFAAFLAPTHADGTPNRNNINRYLRLPPDTDPEKQCSGSFVGDPCINEFYDTRVAYDPYRRRFVILSAARGPVWTGEGRDRAVRRFFAIAVSKTEDPRDGFHQWMTTESNYADWPRMATGDGVLVVAHSACKNPDESDPCGNGDHDETPLLTTALRPMLYAFNMDDLAANHLAPRNWKVCPYETGGGTIYPVFHHGTTAGWTYAVRVGGDTDDLRVYRFKARWEEPLGLHQASVDVGGLSAFREGIHYRGGSLYLAGGILAEERVPDVAPERWRVRGLRLPVFETQDGWRVGPCPGPECLDFDLGYNASDDDEGDIWSYEMGSMAVNEDGDMIVVFGRVPIHIKSSRGQEVRYAIHYRDSRGLQGSRALQEGDTTLRDTFCDGGVKEHNPTVEPYWHAWRDETDSGGTVVCEDQDDYQDYANATVDPTGKAFWIVHAHADATRSGYRMVGGKVVP